MVPVNPGNLVLGRRLGPYLTCTCPDGTTFGIWALYQGCNSLSYAHICAKEPVRLGVIHRSLWPRYAIGTNPRGRCRRWLPRALLDCVGSIDEAQLGQLLVVGPYVAQALLLILGNGSLRGKQMVAARFSLL